MEQSAEKLTPHPRAIWRRRRGIKFPLSLSVRSKAIRDAEVRAFATDRMRAAISFTASLYRTAWEESAELKVPSWLKR